MTRKEAIDDLRVIKGFLAGLSGVTPLCFDYAIEALERKRGIWMPIEQGDKGYSAGDFICSCCGKPNKCYSVTDYCCSCGADMRGKEDVF